ncbi:hypothetical protein HDU99_001564 [Rhizoclosmatium hyalinum]|nr:hypothetical protein HDU99_001564 [Rhizoclosmatium hyalinum]
MAFHTKLGWMTWKDRESSLFALFERVFGCTRAELKFGEAMDTIGVDVEVPTAQVASLEKELRKKYLLAEIDKIHGVSPSVRAPDARLLRTSKSLGSGVLEGNTKSSIVSLQDRIKALHKCHESRRKEVDAILAQWDSMKTVLNDKAVKMDAKIEAKPPRMVEIESWVVDRLMQELKTVQEKKQLAANTNKKGSLSREDPDFFDEGVEVVVLCGIWMVAVTMETVPVLIAAPEVPPGAALDIGTSLDAANPAAEEGI